LARDRLLLHLGVTLLSVIPGSAAALLTGNILYALAIMILLNLLSITGHHLMVAAAYHVLKPLSGILGQDGVAAERMVIGISSPATLRKAGRIPPERILLLLPHCLQNHECIHRITFDPSNCRQCGRCPVGDLVQLAQSSGIQIAVATGGTLARRHVKGKNPLAVIAVACPRDLGQGMLDAWPVPVFGIENSRPCGDCVDTSVDVAAVKRVISDLTG